MYTPADFKNENIEQVKAFIEANSFGILVSSLEAKLVATHIPLELYAKEDGTAVLQGHISRANPQWKNFQTTGEVMAIFPGPHAYISSSWYDHLNVPTWNYIAVHVYGDIRIIEGEELIESLSKMTHKYEKGSKNPVSVENMPREYVLKQLKGLVGFEITISNIQSAYKLSQNRDEANHQNILVELENRGDTQSAEVAREIRQAKKSC
jgi:transcriptional regulator